jgi:glycosyltransferase involved in cell wall biosynthesis
VTRVHQVVSAAGPFDAVTRQALASRALFERWGMAGGVYADFVEPRAKRLAEPLRRLAPGRDDLLLVHYSAYAPGLEELLERPQRKLLLYHNITPPEYLWAHAPHVATLCALGRDHLPRWAAAVDVAAAVSRYNARELEEAGARDVRVVPVLLDPARLEPRGRSPDGSGPLVLSVGRLAPHKRPDLVLRALALYRGECARDARLLLVGEPLSRTYARELGVAPVSLSQPDLNAAYARADVLLSLSEHEGFCIPLLEAFHFGLPVVARPVGGMPEVGGDAVLWVDGGDLAVVAELLDLAVRDAELRAELAHRGRQRLERLLEQHFGISHTTLQMDHEGGQLVQLEDHR